jgi:hyperosmotically inducible periplasmic protein
MFPRVLTLVLAILLAASAPAMAQRERKNLQVFKDVSRIVLDYPTFTIFDDVSADVAEGTVTLYGKVTQPGKRTALESRVARVKGVERVVNHIGVLPTSSDDEVLRGRIARAIYGNAAFWHYAAMPHPPIHIVVENGRVTLTGTVATNMERQLARSLAASWGAASVKNDLKTDAEIAIEFQKIG